MRAGFIAIAGFLGLIAMFLFVTYPQILLLLMNGMVFLLLILGFLVFPFLKKQIPVALKPIDCQEVGLEELEPGMWETPTLEGKPFPIVEPTQLVTISVRLRNLQILFAIGIISLGFFAVGMQGRIATQIELFSPRYIQVYGLDWCSILVLMFAWGWLRERALLRNAGAAIGGFQKPLKGMPVGRLVGYYFRDEGGHYHGDTKLSAGFHGDDNIVLVLFNRGNSDWSMPSWGFMFHKIDLTFSN